MGGESGEKGLPKTGGDEEEPSTSCAELWAGEGWER